jgi:hypothetical protein
MIVTLRNCSIIKLTVLGLTRTFILLLEVGLSSNQVFGRNLFI